MGLLAGGLAAIVAEELINSIDDPKVLSFRLFQVLEIGVDYLECE
jgi:hypothetical protein